MPTRAVCRATVLWRDYSCRRGVDRYSAFQPGSVPISETGHQVLPARASADIKPSNMMFDGDPGFVFRRCAHSGKRVRRLLYGWPPIDMWGTVATTSNTSGCCVSLHDVVRLNPVGSGSWTVSAKVADCTGHDFPTGGSSVPAPGRFHRRAGRGTEGHHDP